MSEFITLSRIFGSSAWPILKEMGDIVVFNVNADDASCFILLGGQEYKITRVNQRGWHVAATGYQRTFWSQADLLSWIGDRA